MGDFDTEAWERLLARAAEAEASDVHLAPGAPIFFRICGNIAEAGAGPTAWVVYEATQESWPRMMRGGQPLTGQSTLGKIVMRQFTAKPIGDRTVLLRLVGENLLTGRTYELETAVTWTGKGT